MNPAGTDDHAAPNDQPRLFGVGGSLAGKSYVVTETPLLIGRVPANDIHISDPQVSRAHARVETHDGHHQLIDCKSRNGTLLNGRPVERAVLQHGDEIQIGEQRLAYLARLVPTCVSGDAPGADAAASPADLTETPADAPNPAVTIQVALPSDQGPSPLEDDAALDSEFAHRLVRQMDVLHEMAGLLVADFELTALLEKIVDLLLKSFEAERGCLLLGEEAQNLQAVGAKNLQDPSRTIVRQVIDERTAFLCSDAQSDALLKGAESISNQELRSILCAPLVNRGRLFGLVYLDSRALQHEYDGRDLWLLNTMANQIAIWLETHGRVSDLRRRLDYYRDQAGGPERSLGGQSDVIREIVDIARRAADSQVTILILGASGTGKEVLARSIHRWSTRHAEPFAVVNCAALSDQLMLSDLFGHERGAFTGAIKQKKGRLELADGGTVFFDEIGELNSELQARLLRFLQEREFDRVGGTDPIRVDVRIIAATNRDLAAEVADGRFREDLYYRLRVVETRIPSLRERPEDIPLLAQDLLRECEREMGRSVEGFAPDALLAMKQHDWPGNVRELRNCVERAMVLGAGSTITARDMGLLPTPAAPQADTVLAALGSLSFHDQILEVKRRIIRAALQECGDVKAEAAKRLGLQPSYLSRLMKKLDLR